MIQQSITSVLLCSGGLDSTTLAYWLRDRGKKFIPLFINYGQHCTDTEYESLHEALPREKFSEIVKIDVADVYKGTKSRLITEADLWLDVIADEDLYLPYRNLLLLSMGAAFAQSREIKTVYAAFINSNRASEIDCSTTFFDNLGNLLKDYGSVKIEMPFREMSKFEVAKIGLELRAPIANTFSCQVSSKIPCGACPNCVERLEALLKFI